MEIQTNKVYVEYNYIDKYFDVYVMKFEYLKYNKDFFSKIVSLLNSARYDKVYSIYRKENKLNVYLLVPKEYSMNIKLDDIFDTNELMFFNENKAIQFAVYNNSFNDKNEIIINLLLCGLSRNANKVRISCYNGKIFELIKNSKNHLITLKYSLEDMCVKSEVVTFSKATNYDNGTFNLVGDYLVKSGEEGTKYIVKGDKHKKNNINYFNTKTYDQFRCCKMVKMEEIINLFNFEYKDFIKLSFEKYEFREKVFQSYKDKAKSYRKKSFDLAKKLGVNIVSKIENYDTLKALINSLSENNINSKVSDKFEKEMLNVHLIHSADYYKENDLIDEHVTNNDIAVQNMTLENSLLTAGENLFVDINAFEIVIFEVIRKYELIRKQIILYKTDNEILNKYCFGQIVKNGNDVFAYEISIDQSNMEFCRKDLGSGYIKNCENGQKYMRLKNSDQRITLSVTPQYPIVDVEHLDDLYKKTLREISIEEDLLPLLKLIREKIKNKQVFDEIVDYINLSKNNSMANLYEQIKYKIFPLDKQKRRDYSNTLKSINSELCKINDSVFFKPLWRKKGGKYNTTFSNFKYRYDESNGLLYYSASCKSVNESISKGYPIRKIKCRLTENETQDFLNLLDVDNIRNNQNIVEPFPYKYLREYIKLI